MESKASKNDFSPEERIRKLEAQVTQLKNVIVKKQQEKQLKVNYSKP